MVKPKGKTIAATLKNTTKSRRKNIFSWVLSLKLACILNELIRFNLLNEFKPSVAFHIKTSHLICSANHMAGVYVKCNTELICVKLQSNFYRRYSKGYGLRPWSSSKDSDLATTLRRYFSHKVAGTGSSTEPNCQNLDCLTRAKLGDNIWTYPVGNYIFKVNRKNTRTRCEICSKLTSKTPERCKWRHSGVFIVDSEYISHLVCSYC